MNTNYRIGEISKSLIHIRPEIALVLTLIIIIFFGLVQKKKRALLPYISLAGILTSFVLLLVDKGSEDTYLFYEMLRFDKWSFYFKVLILLAGILAIVFSILNDDDEEAQGSGEYFSLIISAVAGLMLLVSSANLIILYLSLEFVSIASYLLTIFSFNKKSSEAALKYVLFGMFASCIMLYGLSLIYGFTGTLNFMTPEFGAGLSAGNQVGVLIAATLAIAGFLFKISAAPFHLWTPDVYEASPTPVVAFFSTAPKIGAFAIFLKFAFSIVVLQNLTGYWSAFMLGLAFFSLAVGNFGALVQRNSKRMLAYSSIAHTGFILMVFASLNLLEIREVMFYLTVLLFMNFAGFILVEKVAQHSGSYEMDQWKGLGSQFPATGVLMVLVMISLTGLPPTAGFYAKFLIFTGVWKGYQATGNKWNLALLSFGILNTMLALFYYLRMPYLMFFKKAANSNRILTSVSYGYIIFVSLLTIPLIVFFIKPDWLISIINWFLN